MADPYRFLSGLGQAHLIKSISILVNDDEDLLRFLFSKKDTVIRAPARCLIEEATRFSHADQLLVRVALDYWNRRGYARLGDMLSAWDHEHWIRFIHSLTTLQECKDDLMDQLQPPRKRKIND